MSVTPARKARLRANKERAAREQYVLSAAVTRSTVTPFLDTNWDAAARKYIETGDESLKEQFPKPRKDEAS